MRAKKCDRCGKLFEHYDGVKEFKNTEKANAIYLIDRDLDNKYCGRKYYDLCLDCMKKLENFLKEEHGATGINRKNRGTGAEAGVCTRCMNASYLSSTQDRE